MAQTCRPSTSMSTSPTAPISRPPGGLAQPSTRRYGFGSAWPSALVAKPSVASKASAASGVLLLLVMASPLSSAARRSPTGGPRLAFCAEPALAFAFVDARVVVRRCAAHVVDARAFAVDVALDVATVGTRSLRRRRPVARLRLRFVVAIVLGIRELARPDAAACTARLVLLVHVVFAVTPIRRRESRAHHLRAEIRGAAPTDGDDASVIVDVALRAADRSVADQAAQLARRFIAARPGTAVARAGLPALDRVDAEETQPRRADLERIAIHDFRSAADALLR